MGFELIDKYFPHFQDVGYFFKLYLQKYITPESRILDVGCGHQAFGAEHYKVAKWRVGVDPNKEALDSNTLMDEKILSDIEHMPDFAEKFDVVISQFVLEHIATPDEVVKKVAEACESGGYFIFMTSNIYSPLILISKFTPTFMKQLLKKHFLGVDERDTFPTKYKVNSMAKLDYYLTKHEFRKVEVRMVGVLTYFSFNKAVLFAKSWLDKITDPFRFFDRFKTHIVGVYEKV